MNRWTLGLAGLLLLASAAPAAAKETPQWPVRNPLILKPTEPSLKQRTISGFYGPRLKWGANRYDHHEGWDFYAFYDPAHKDGHHPVHSILSGKVVDIIDPPNPERVETGRKVVIGHKMKWSAFGAPSSWGHVFTGYLHLHQIGVKKGQSVEGGDVVGTAGATGYTKTVHLHFNCYRHDGKRYVNVNPGRIFKKKVGRFLLPLDKRTARAKVLHRDKDKKRLVLRVLVVWNCQTFDGMILDFGKEKRGFSFELISDKLRDKRDRGDKDLFDRMQLYPLKFNGGESVHELNTPRRVPSSWPARQFPVKTVGPWQGWDLVVSEVPEGVDSVKLTLLGCNGEKLKTKLKFD